MFTETVGLLRMGAQDGHLDFHTAPELCNGYSKCCPDLPPRMTGCRKTVKVISHINQRRTTRITQLLIRDFGRTVLALFVHILYVALSLIALR